MQVKGHHSRWFFSFNESGRRLQGVWYKKDNCASQSEFIEKAEHSLQFLPAAITSAMAGVVESAENRTARLLFKLAVEMSMVMNIIASNENSAGPSAGTCP